MTEKYEPSFGKKLVDGFHILNGFEDSVIVAEEECNSETREIKGSVFKPELHYSQDNPFEMYLEDP